MVSTFSCTYSFQTDGTIKPHNTGYSGIDTDYDRIIGKDAEEKWKICKEREKIKEKIIKENKITKHNLTVVDGEYKIISDEESDKIRRIRGFNNSVINLQNRKKTGESIG